jgi:Predicted aminopeptidases
MKRTLFLLFVLQFCFGVYAQKASKERLKKIVCTLADDSLKGRESGSKDALMTADFIAKNYVEMGLQQWNGDSYFSDFKVNDKMYRNVLGIIEGNDSVLKHEYIVVGAHFDHLGMSKKNGSNTDDVIFNGADDNASGTAAVMEIARLLLMNQDKLKRSVIIANFDGEEVGLYGSNYLANNCFVPIEDVKLMLSIDMVGYLKVSHTLKYVGVGTFDNAKAFVKEIPWNEKDGKIDLRKFEKSVFTGTDTRGFAMRNIPTLFVTTGLKSPYHKVSDEAERIDFDGLAKVTDHVFSLVKSFASEAVLEPSGKIAQVHGGPRALASAGYMFSLGNSRIKYHQGPVTGKKSVDFSLGFYSRLYFGHKIPLSLRLDAAYERFSTPTELGKFNAHSVTCPLRLEIQLPLEDFGSFYISGGAYYRYYFAAKINDRECDFSIVEHDDKGWLWSVGLNVLDKFFIEATSFYGLQNPILDAPIELNNRTGILSVGFGF